MLGHVHPTWQGVCAADARGVPKGCTSPAAAQLAATPGLPRFLSPLQELLLSKLLRTATLAGRGTQSAIEEFLRSIREEQGQGAAPAQHPSMRRSGANGATGGSNGASAAAAAGPWESSGAAAAAKGHLGEDETVRPSFKQQEADLMEELGTMGGDSEVQLPLERAKTVIRQVPRPLALPCAPAGAC